MQIYGWELLKISQHLDKFCEHWNCDSGDIGFLICSVTSPEEHMFKELCEFTGGIPSRRVSAIGDIKYLMSRDLTKPGD